MPQEISAATLLDREVLDKPCPFYRQLQRDFPVWHVPGTEIFVVSRHALIEEATRRVDEFSSNMRGVLYRRRNGTPARLTRNSGLVQALATADPPFHAIHKKAVFPDLVARRMATMANDIEQVTNECVTRMLQTGARDFMAEVGNRVPITVVSKLVGFNGKGSEIPKLLQAAFDSTAVVGATLSLGQLARCLWRSLLTQRWIAGQLNATSSEGDNLLASVRRGIAANALSAAEGRAIIHIMLAAGGESTSSLLGSAVGILASDQALQQTLRAQPELIPHFLEEVLRLESPFRFHLRSVLHDTELGGVALPADATVLLFWGAANRDPEMFDKPDEIDLARPRTHMTFGRGIHTCIGAPLARLEGKIVLRTLLERTRRISLDVDSPPRWVESLAVRRYETLPLNLE